MEQQPNNEKLQDKIILAHLTMKKKSPIRKRRRQDLKMVTWIK